MATSDEKKRTTKKTSKPNEFENVDLELPPPACEINEERAAFREITKMDMVDILLSGDDAPHQPVSGDAGEILFEDADDLLAEAADKVSFFLRANLDQDVSENSFLLEYSGGFETINYPTNFDKSLYSVNPRRFKPGKRSERFNPLSRNVKK